MKVDNRGTVLATAMGVVLFISLLGIASMILMVEYWKTTHVMVQETKNFYLAEAGIVRAMWNIDHDNTGNFNFTDGNPTRTVNVTLTSQPGYNKYYHVKSTAQ